MKSPVLMYVLEPGPDTAFHDLDPVRLVRSVTSDDGETIPEGSDGTVVGVWGDGEAYEVEFARPFQALATVDVGDLISDAPGE